MFYGWPTYQIVIFSILMLLCMSALVWSVRKSAGGQFALSRFFLGLLIAALFLGAWTYGLIVHPRQTKTITGIAAVVAYLAFMAFLVAKYLRNKNRKGA